LQGQTLDGPAPTVIVTMLLRTSAKADPLCILLGHGRIRQGERKAMHGIQVCKAAFLESFEDERVFFDRFVGTKYLTRKERRLDVLQFLPRNRG